jgi:N-acetylneuraminic acid mutarotase
MGVVLVVLFGLAVLFAGCASKATSSTAVSESSSTIAGATTTPAAATVTTPATGAQGTWSNLNPGGILPSAREGHSMVYDPTSGKVILFGGAHPLSVDETWDYNPSTNTWTNLNPVGGLPPARSGHSMVYDSTTGKVILFGGAGSSYFNDTWDYDPTTNAWTNLKPTGSLPSVRSGQSLAYDSGTGKVILFGGWDGTSYFNDTWAYDPSANAWTNLKPTGILPSVRSSHSLVYDPGTGKVILFGGMIAVEDAKTDSEVADVYDDTWAYDPAANTWTNLKPAGSLPGARADHSMVYDSGTSRMLLFGGWDGKESHDDTWAYDPAANIWANLKPAGSLPSARAFYSMVYASDTGQVILFGGTDSGAFLDDTWTYAGKG